MGIFESRKPCRNGDGKKKKKVTDYLFTFMGLNAFTDFGYGGMVF